MTDIKPLPPGKPDGTMLRRAFAEAAEQGIIPKDVVDALPKLGVEWEQVAYEARAMVVGVTPDHGLQAVALTMWIQGYIRGLGTGAYSVLKLYGDVE